MPKGIFLKKEFPQIIKWNTIEQEYKKYEVFNKLLFDMFMFYRKYIRRYKLLHENDIKPIEELNLEIEKILNEISLGIDTLLELKFYIHNSEILECLDELVEECSIKLHPGLPFGILEKGKKIDNSIKLYLDYFKKN